MKVLSVDGLSKLITLMKEEFASSSSLSTVATSGSYNDLSNKPTIPEGLPSQSGNSGKFLTTNGTSVSWATVDALPLSGGTLTGTLTFDSIPNAIKIKSSGNGHIKFTNTSGNTAYGYIYGSSSGVGIYSPNLSKYIFFSDNGIYGNSTNTLGTSSDKWSKIYATTLNNGNDISIPTSSGTLALTSQLPSIATTSTAGLVKPDGTTITITNDGTITAVGGGGSSYTAGTGIDITNDVISVTSPTLTNKQHNASGSSLVLGSTGSYSNDGGKAIGISHLGYSGWYSLGAGAISIGGLNASGGRAINIGGSQCSGDYSIQLGFGSNTESNSFYVGLSSSNNYKLLGSDGKIPSGRLQIATSVSSSSTNDETVGAKLFYDTVGDIESALHTINSGS